jgi:GNAT superfamily N-acetyltransferase
LPEEWRRDGFLISTDKPRLDLDAIHAFLARSSYWARGVPIDVVRRCIENSLPFGVYDGDGRQVGFGRVITDYATFAYISDVFVLPTHRGRGLARWLVEVMIGHPDLQGLRRWMLATQDAHGLYRGAGFVPVAHPERWMERHFPDVYRVRPPVGDADEDGGV